MLIDIIIQDHNNKEEYLLRTIETDDADWKNYMPEFIEDFNKYSYLRKKDEEMADMNK